jgi:hypothetical protein
MPGGRPRPRGMPGVGGGGGGGGKGSARGGCCCGRRRRCCCCSASPAFSGLELRLLPSVLCGWRSSVAAAGAAADAALGSASSPPTPPVSPAALGGVGVRVRGGRRRAWAAGASTSPPPGSAGGAGERRAAAAFFCLSPAAATPGAAAGFCWSRAPPPPPPSPPPPLADAGPASRRTKGGGRGGPHGSALVGGRPDGGTRGGRIQDAVCGCGGRKAVRASLLMPSLFFFLFHRAANTYSHAMRSSATACASAYTLPSIGWTRQGAVAATTLKQRRCMPPSLPSPTQLAARRLSHASTSARPALPASADTGAGVPEYTVRV